MRHLAGTREDRGMSTPTQQPTATSQSNESSSEPTVSFFEDPLRIQTILVPLDDSAESYRAFEFALPLAKRFGATIHIVHVYEGAHQFSSIATTPILWVDSEIAWRMAEKIQRRFGSRPLARNCHLRTGKPFQEIANTAQELKADLIVVATHGHGG